MRWSNTFIPTLREDPQDAEAVSHKLMVRAGLIRRLTAGAYTYLPLGYKILRKAENIVREEMNAAGASELLMPALQPVELWKKTGRYEDIGDVMIKFQDRHGKEVALGPTHEEIITDLVSGEIRSYKDLPLTLYQIQNKFRDEVRPRFGIVRSCEFIMKDAYSFDVDTVSMEKSYRKMYDAYCRIFDRCGLPYIPVEADPGLMGGTVSHEFMIPTGIGEDTIALCSSCGYSASTEVASCAEEGDAPGLEEPPGIEEVATPGMSSVEDVSSFLKREAKNLIKTLIYIADDEPVAVLLRGDHEANEAKIKKCLGVSSLELADESGVEKVTGGPMGFSGPVELNGVKKIADLSIRSMPAAVTGSNRKDTHLKNVFPGRDFEVNEWGDIRVITEDDKCPRCGENIEIKQSIEIGHTFKLGTKYSEKLGAGFLDENGKERPLIMGCYGIGVNRILASLIETSHDDKGIIWPMAISPFEVIVIPLKKGEEAVEREAERIYSELIKNGIDAIMDDRDKSPGVKFKDADLIGFPIQVVVGKKSLEKNKIELTERSAGEKALVEKEDIVERVKDLVKKGRKDKERRAHV
ncbi:MAG: proline--tRNA ligase [Candidatus Omnitrophica bacterium]|nr:proline--tRNA ligase [Candidatus Omnitrophota bacterium]